MISHSIRVLLAAGLVGLLACSADGGSEPIGPGGSSGSDASAGGSAQGGAAGSVAEGGEAGEGEGGQGGEAGQGGATEQGGSSGGGGEDAGPACDKRWSYDICTLSAGATAGAEVKGGGLVLTETASPFLCGSALWPPYTVKVYQTGLTGDFTAVFDYEAFESGGYGVGVHAFVVELNNDQEAAAASILDSGAGTTVKAMIEHEGQKQEESKSTSSKAGKLTIQRLGGFLTVTAAAGGDTKSVTSQFTKNTLVVGIAMQGPYEPADPPVATSVLIPAFHVTGGGGKVTADTFDCNSIK